MWILIIPFAMIGWLFYISREHKKAKSKRMTVEKYKAYWKILE
jgi:hypothetical protein